MRKAIKWIGLAVGLVGAFVLLGFVEGHRLAGACEGVDIRVKEIPNGLVDENDVRMAIQADDGPQVGRPLAEVHTADLEAVLVDLPHVARASVYKTIDKRLVVEVEPRRPVIRIIDRNGHDAFLDAEGCVIPVSRERALRLPVITGHFDLDPEAVRECRPLADTTDSHLLQIRDFASVIVADPFWRAQLQHTTIDQNGDFISVSRVGGHRINFGDAHDMDDKLKALRALYREGFDATTWNKYAAINLKYENQIICTQKK